MKIFFIATTFLFFTVLDIKAQQDNPEYMSSRIEAAQFPDRGGFDRFSLLELMERLRVPSVSIAVIKDYKIHWAKTYGIADMETGQRADTTTMYQAASVSKPVFAMLLVKLAHAGKISLDTDVNQYLRSFRVPDSISVDGKSILRNSPVTLRSLLSHLSGADDGFGFPGYSPADSLPGLSQVVRGERPSVTRSIPFRRQPYAAFRYSGGGYIIAQLAVEEYLNQPLAELMDEYLFSLLGLKNSTFRQPLPELFWKRAARGHAGNGKRAKDPWHVFPEQAPAGLWTTPSDLARLMIELQKAISGIKNDVLSQHVARELLTPTGIGNMSQGFVIERRGEGWYFLHGGANWNYRARIVGHLRNGYGVIVMTNGENGGDINTEIEARVIAAYNWDALAKPVK